MKQNKHLRNFLIAIIVVAILLGVLGSVLLIDRLNNKVDQKITVEEAQEMVDATLDSLPNNVALSAKYIRSRSNVTVKELEYGTEKDIILHCTYETIDVRSTIENNVNDILGSISINDPKTGKPKNATKVQLEVADKVQTRLESAPALSGEIDVYIYEVEEGLKVYLSDEFVNTVFGGILDAQKIVQNTTTITKDGGETVDITNRNSLRNGCIACFKLANYDMMKPDTSSPIQRAFNDFKEEFGDVYGYFNHSTFDDIAQKAFYYLDNKDEREQKALEAQKFVHQEHLWKNRAQKISEMIN